MFFDPTSYSGYGFVFPTLNTSAHVTMDLQNIIFTVTVFHTALLLTGGLISQLMKCVSGLVLVEVTGLTMFPIIVTHLPKRTEGMAIWRSGFGARQTWV